MPKYYLKTNVLEESENRLSYIFDEFDKVYLSFSAGKDSTVMLHLAIKEAIKRNIKIGLLIVDLEGQYKLTIEHALSCIDEYKDYLDVYWVCLPIHLRNAVSVYEPFWKCWDSDKKEDWIRTPPDFAITDINYFPFFRDGMEFEEFVPEFGEWYADGEKTACLVGIRSDESLNRYRTIASKSKIRYKEKCYTTLVTKNVFNAYPIYDWRTEDIWVYHFKNQDKRYNQLYEMMHKAGLSIHQQRICQPYGDDQRRGLWLFHLIEPETWAKVVSRVNGANSGALYVNESGAINGYNRIEKPNNHTWESFYKMLIESFPCKTQKHLKDRINLYIKKWLNRGYCVIPHETPYILESRNLTPSYRKICKCLLRNDYWCKELGFSAKITNEYRIFYKIKI